MKYDFVLISIHQTFCSCIFNALLFFYRHILKREPGEIKDTIRTKRKQYIPVVLTREEINAIGC
jgi:hypothetical protein